MLKKNIPQHVAIIMDGNGRWAQQRDLFRIEGHKAGVDAVKRVIECCMETQIPILSLFAFSSENWSRPSEEIHFLMQLFLDALQREVTVLHENHIRLCFTGNREGLPEPLCEAMDEAQRLTQDNTALTLNLVMNYGGRHDIIQAVKSLVKEVQAEKLDIDTLDEACFGQHLLTGNLPEPDLFIRTSGEKRLSNFFLWQLAYTELYFTKTLWPDFDRIEFEAALCSFSRRERRYGKTSEQVKETVCLSND